MTDGAEGAAPSAAPPRWGIGDAILAFAAGLVGTVFTGSVYVLAGGDVDSTGGVIAYLIGLWAGMAGVAVLASRRKGTGSLADDFGLRLEGRDVVWAMLVGLACNLLLVNAVVQLFQLIGPDLDVGQQAENITGDAEGWRLALLAPFLVIGAPLVEELFFRGLLQRSLIRRLGPGTGITLSSLAFGLVHATGDLTGWSMLALMTALGLLGAVLGVLAHRTGRLGPGIVAHATFNLVTVAALAWG